VLANQTKVLMLARQAVPEDWPGIEALRDACYARWGLPVQARDGLAWLIAEHEGRIVCAVGYRDEADAWCILDWYATEDRQGKAGTAAVLKRLLAEADTQGKTILGVSCMEVFITHALRRGFRFVGVALQRGPEGRHGCPD
jgi:hypothetical protein